MTQKAVKLLERMRKSKAGWKRRDLDRLYISFGFLISHGASHDIVKHPDYPNLRTTLPRHNEIAKVYIEVAIRLIDTSLELQNEQRHGHQAES